MTRWTVDPEELRSASSIIGYAVEIAEPETATAATANVGDGELARALSEFMQALTGGWMQRVSQTESVEQTLKASAALYEEADGNGLQDICLADGF